jgi:hypothetical protein
MFSRRLGRGGEGEEREEEREMGSERIYAVIFTSQETYSSRRCSVSGTFLVSPAYASLR